METPIIKGDVYGLYTRMTTPQLQQLLKLKEWMLRTHRTDAEMRKIEHIKTIKAVLRERKQKLATV